MKHIVKYSLKWCLAITFSLLCFACEKDANFKEYAYPVPEITGIYPASGYVGSQVAILGKDFGDQIEAVKVTKPRRFFHVQTGVLLWSCQMGHRLGKSD